MISGKISTDDSAFDVLVEPIDEECMILKDTCNITSNYTANKKQTLSYKYE